MAALGGKRTLAKVGWGTNEPNDKVYQPNDSEAENHEGCLTLRLTAVGHFWSAVPSEVEQPCNAKDGDDRADKG